MEPLLKEESSIPLRHNPAGSMGLISARYSRTPHEMKAKLNPSAINKKYGDV